MLLQDLGNKVRHLSFKPTSLVILGVCCSDKKMYKGRIMEFSILWLSEAVMLFLL